MDPDMTLHEIREMVAEVLASKGQAAPSAQRDPQELAEARLFALATAFESLDGWLTKGGYVPGAWLATEDHR
jgi:hypothetical protein